MVEEERLKKIAKFRSILEKRLKDMEAELEGLQALLEFTEEMLLDRGFKRADSVKSNLISQPKLKESLPLKTVSGDLLANLFIQEDSIRIIPSEREFNINTPPFKSFFIDRVLSKMSEKDQKAMRSGEIPADQTLSYKIAHDGDLIQEIIIRNITPDRLREIKSAIRWTLEKMYEKTSQES